MVFFFCCKKFGDDVVVFIVVFVEDVLVLLEEGEQVEQLVDVFVIGIFVQVFCGVGVEVGLEVVLFVVDVKFVFVQVCFVVMSLLLLFVVDVVIVIVFVLECCLLFVLLLFLEQIEIVVGMKDNVLFCEVFIEIEVGVLNEQLFGVMCQVLQGYFYICVNGDVWVQISEGKLLLVVVVCDGD